MKTIIIILSLVLLTGLIYFIYLGFKSQSGVANGIVNNQLSPCPDTPNCISTEFEDDSSHYTDAIKYTAENNENIMQTIIEVIKETDGSVIKTDTDYISATYTSSIFRYVDDFEIRLDKDNQLIQIRSASRVGRSDFGANLKRINHFKNRLSEKLN